MRRLTFPLPCVVIVVVVCCVTLGAAAADAFTDYDHRAARALYNTLKPGAVASKDKADPARLSQPVKKEGNKAVYTIDIAGKDGGSMMSGYYRISVNVDLSDAKDWKDLGVDKNTGAQILQKPVTKTTAEPYVNYAVRKKTGNVTLTVAMKRPYDEDPNAAVTDMHKRYVALLGNAKENQLFAGVRLRITGGEPEPPATGDASGAEPLKFGTAGDTPVKVFYAASVTDTENNPIPGVKKMKIRLTGRIAKFADIECKRAKKVGDLWEIDDPQASEEFTLVVRANDEAFKQALYEQAAAGEEAARTPLISVKVSASFK